MTSALSTIRHCLEGAIPGIIATCDREGFPNVSYVSQVHYVDADQVALSFQFFNKTRRNMLQNPQMTAYVMDPVTTARYRLALLYLRTETEGPLFQNMKAKLAGIASHTGMSGVFELKGADICRVLEVEAVPGAIGALPARNNTRNNAPRNWLSVLRSLGERMARQLDLAALFEETLAGLGEEAGISHSMILMADSPHAKLYTVATQGYAQSGVGSEIPFGAGVIGVAAQYCVPIRINHHAAEYGYGQAVRAAFRGDAQLETAIPFPGLPQPHSQLALPVLQGSDLLAVIYVESDQDMGFTYDDEDALAVLARLLADAIARVQWLPDATDREAGEPPVRSALPVAGGRPLQVRFFAANQSVFLDEEYLIKGVAGAILWRLLARHAAEQRVDFSNRELRLDPQLKLPEVDDNLEARLILLRRRLVEKTNALAIVKTGRGRFRLQLNRPVQLIEQST
ncbi:MAG: GAF domain-containing protein [Pseudomonadales bacterium]|nr:GAF domain-containing protein [Pseudomonadales bacterium]